MYSATLFVAIPMVSLTEASSRGGSRLASRTTAPTPAGPGFPREPPSQKIRMLRIAGSRPGNGRWSRARDEDGAAVVAVRDVAVGAGLADPGHLGRRDREPAPLAACCRPAGPRRRHGRGPATVVERQQIGRDPRGRRRARVGLGRDLGVDDRLLLGDRGPGGARLVLGVARRGRRSTPSSPSIDSWLSISSSSRSSSARWWRRSCSISLCIAWSSRGEVIEPEYIAVSTSPTFATADAASSSSRFTSRLTTSCRPRTSAIGASSSRITASACVRTARSGSVARRWRRWSIALSCSWTTRSCSSGVVIRRATYQPSGAAPPPRRPRIREAAARSAWWCPASTTVWSSARSTVVVSPDGAVDDVAGEVLRKPEDLACRPPSGLTRARTTATAPRRAA